jgi:hypothetical protein
MRKVSTWGELLAATTYELPYEDLAGIFLAELENAVPEGATGAEIWSRAYTTISPIAHAVVQEISQRDVEMYAEIVGSIRNVLIKCIAHDAEEMARWKLEDELEAQGNVISFPIGGRYGHTPDDCA